MIELEPTPETIYLQRESQEITWCDSRVEASDMLYFRADVVYQFVAAARKAQRWFGSYEGYLEPHPDEIAVLHDKLQAAIERFEHLTGGRRPKVPMSQTLDEPHKLIGPHLNQER